MERNRDGYVSPLSTRYASREMQYLFSDNNKFRTWRRLWIALAEAERELGLHITEEQIDELKAHAEDVNYDVAEARERVVRHDVMSHVYAYGQQCPRRRASSTWAPPPAMWGTTRTSSSSGTPPGWC